MPKSKKRRKNGTVVSGKMKNHAAVSEGSFSSSSPSLGDDTLALEVWLWVESQGYGDELSYFAGSSATDDAYRAYLDHLREGYRCFQIGEPWTYIPPFES